MPLLPNLVGNVMVRERAPKTPHEPRYRRLDFVRPKPLSDSGDSWPIISSVEPQRGIQLYTAQPHYYRLPAHHYYQHHAHARFPPGHAIYQVPAPRLSTGQGPRQIEAGPAIEEIDSDDEIIQIVEEATKKGKGKSKDKKKDKKGKKKATKVIPSGHSIFEESSDSESDYVPIKKSKRKGRRYHV